MDSLIRIGSEKEAIKEAGRQIAEILQAGFDTHADQETIRHAISAVQASAEVKNASISHCQLSHNSDTGNSSMTTREDRMDRVLDLLESLLKSKNL